MLAEIQRLRYRHALLLTSAASPDDGLSSPNPRQLYTTQNEEAEKQHAFWEKHHDETEKSYEALIFKAVK